MRDRNAGVGEPADAGRDAGDDPERHAGLHQAQRLLSPAAEDERVTALEPQDALVLARQLHQAQRDVDLLGRRPAAALAGVLQNRVGAGHVQDPLVDQRVVDDVVGLLQRGVAGERHQGGVARPGTDEPHPTRLHLR